MADYDSNFETDTETERRHEKRKDLAVGSQLPKKKKVEKEEAKQEFSRDEGQRRRMHFVALDAYSRHKMLVNEYLLNHPGASEKLKRDTSKDKTDLDVIKEHHKFLWDEEEPLDSWEQRLAKKYWDRLFKEYCICDLTRYKENKVAMRWRTEKEVLDGKGQFICGEKRCEGRKDLKSWEVNFAYIEDNQKKNALVKLRLCSECSSKLNYHHQRREAKRKKMSIDKTPINPSHKSHSSEIESHRKSKKHSRSSDPDNTATTSKTDSIEEKSADGRDIWSKPIQAPIEKSKDSEFDEYLEDLLA